ncbi:MAG TPA: hypothetical protein VH328_07015, partial [Burkholderiaceae bacterium]|nr:hypothetical protein [Burkholderiaceae bacterium]
MNATRQDVEARVALTRREWLRRSGALLAGGATLGPLAGLAGAGGGGSGYKALVCIELAGGNDGLNTMPPIDADRYAQYAAVRGPLALPLGSILPLDASHGLHPSLAALVPYWNAGTLATMFNVGPLYEPLTQAQYLELPEGSPEIPGNLFSHSDQLKLWESGSSDPDTRTGWGGLASALLGTPNPV